MTQNTINNSKVNFDINYVIGRIIPITVFISAPIIILIGAILYLHQESLGISISYVQYQKVLPSTACITIFAAGLMMFTNNLSLYTFIQGMATLVIAVAMIGLFFPTTIGVSFTLEEALILFIMGSGISVLAQKVDTVTLRTSVTFYFKLKGLQRARPLSISGGLQTPDRLTLIAYLFGGA